MVYILFLCFLKLMNQPEYKLFFKNLLNYISLVGKWMETHYRGEQLPRQKPAEDTMIKLLWNHRPPPKSSHHRAEKG